VTDRFGIGRALDRLLPCLLPVGDSLHTQACLCIMMRQEFRLSLSGLGELGFEHQGNPLVILLSRALEQRLICRILNQGMLEKVACLRRQSSLIEHFSLYQFGQCLLQPWPVYRRNDLEQLVGKLPSQHRPNLRHFFGRPEPIQARHQ